MHDEIEALITPVGRLSRDLVKGLRQKGGGITSTEARFMVDMYYTMQEQRVRINNQTKGLERDAEKAGNTPEPHDGLDWTLVQFSTLEKQVARLLQVFTETHPMAWFFEQTLGIGPVLAAGLLAHIDIRKAPTVGHIWNFAGLNPETQWAGRDEAKKIWAESIGEDLEEKLFSAAGKIGRNPERLLHMATTKPDGTPVPLSASSCIAAIARKPFNSQLKTLCWKIGDSFVKVSGREDAVYGRLYRERKAIEWRRNLSGANQAAAANALAAKKIGKDTDAFAWYSGACDPDKAAALLEEGKPPTAASCKAIAGSGVPMIPPAQVDMRARRWAVKLFLSHLHQRWYEEEYATAPPKPFAIAIQNHAHYIEPPQVRPETAA
jgi:hypothetical protein